RRTQDLAREQWLAGAKGRRTDLDDQLVEQPGIVELPGEISPANDPDVLAIRHPAHLAVDGDDVALHKPDVRIWNSWQVAPGEYPGGLRVRPGRPGFPGDRFRVAQHPLVRRRPHGQRTDITDELWIAGLLQAAQGEQPIQRVALRSNESIEGGSH